MLQTLIAAALEAGRAIMQIYTHPDTDWQVERKADNSPLTLADRQAHTVIARMLAETPYPLLSEEGAHAPYDTRSHWQAMWIVDPLDGTKEFLKRNGEFTVNIALVRNGQPVMGVIYVPAQYRLYWGVEGEGAFAADVDAATYTVGQPCALKGAMELSASTCRVVASRSHLSPETEAYIENLRSTYQTVECVSAGSSLKFCLLAEGKADVYPRFAPTMEWDTAAGHAIVKAAGFEVLDAATGAPLHYNKADLYNPYFIVKRA